MALQQAQPVAVTEQTFDEEVLHAKPPVLVDFWAEWCGPCRMVAPVVEEVAREKAGILKVMKLNVDENGSIAERYAVLSIPSLILFRDGREVERLIGFMPKELLLTRLRPHLAA